MNRSCFSFFKANVVNLALILEIDISYMLPNISHNICYFKLELSYPFTTVNFFLAFIPSVN